MEATFSFIDLAGFVALTESHGDETAADLALRFQSVVKDTLGAEGTLRKTIGDAVLVSSPTPDAAILLISRLWKHFSEEANFLLVRAGLHHGEAVERGGDIFGAAVNIAARVAAQAGGGQVLATAEVSDAAKRHGVPVTELGAFALRNLRTPVRLFELTLTRGVGAGVIDPVCRMRVSTQSAPGRLHHDGHEFYFCSLECTTKFAQAPGRYVTEGTRF